MRTKIEYKRLKGEELVEALILALKEDGDYDHVELAKLETEIRNYVVDGEKEYRNQMSVEAGFQVMSSLGDRSDGVKDDYYINYDYEVEINGREFKFSGSSYIKDQCICDVEYDFDSLTEVIEVEISEREYLLTEFNHYNAKIEKAKGKIKKYEAKLKEAQEKYDEVAKALENIEE